VCLALANNAPFAIDRALFDEHMLPALFALAKDDRQFSRNFCKLFHFQI